MSGAELAAELIRRRGVEGARIEETSDTLSEHYDRFRLVLRLSHDVYHHRSLAALGVAAHEAGHAIQHAKSSGPLEWRSLRVTPAKRVRTSASSSRVSLGPQRGFADS